MQTIAVAGASLAGLSAARALRAQGFDGRIVLVGDEPHAPYDRPPLSKEFLGGRADVAALSLAVDDDEGLGLEWRLGVRAEGIEPGAAPVLRLSTGELLHADGLVIATGARARTLPGIAPLGVHTLRTLDDAVALRAELRPGSRLVVVGAGFIGAEVASPARDLGLAVTVVEVAENVLAGPLGAELGDACGAWHEHHGVRLVTGIAVVGFSGDRRVTSVRLADGGELPADVVVVGIGSVPNTAWLAGSGVPLARDGGVLTDAEGRTGRAGVVATGDCASRHDAWAGRVVRTEHWTDALQHPRQAAAALLGAEPPPLRAVQAVPYFWSDQYGVKLQFAGHRAEGDAVELVEGAIGGAPADGLLAVYRRDGTPVAVLAVNRPREFGRWRRELAALPAAAHS